jgi:predicted Zn-dependent protease
MNKNTEAIAIWRARAQERPDSVAALTVLFRAEFEAGFAACAERTARRICALKPESADWQCTHGIVLLSIGRIEDALEALRRARNFSNDPALESLIAKAEGLATEVCEAKNSAPAYALVQPIAREILEAA